MAIIDFDPKTTAELNAMRQTMKIIEDLGATVRAAELNAKTREEDLEENNAKILKYLAEGNTRAEKPKKRDFVSMNPSDAQVIGEKYIEDLGPALSRKAQSTANMIAKRPEKSLDKVARDVANKIASDGLIAAMEEVKRIISERIEKGVDYKGNKVEDLEEEYKTQKQRDHGHVYPVGNATGQVIDNLAPGKRNIKLKRK